MNQSDKTKFFFSLATRLIDMNIDPRTLSVEYIIDHTLGEYIEGRIRQSETNELFFRFKPELEAINHDYWDVIAKYIASQLQQQFYPSRTEWYEWLDQRMAKLVKEKL